MPPCIKSYTLRNTHRRATSATSWSELVRSAYNNIFIWQPNAAITCTSLEMCDQWRTKTIADWTKVFLEDLDVFYHSAPPQQIRSRISEAGGSRRKYPRCAEWSSTSGGELDLNLNACYWCNFCCGGVWDCGCVTVQSERAPGKSLVITTTEAWEVGSSSKVCVWVWGGGGANWTKGRNWAGGTLPDISKIWPKRLCLFLVLGKKWGGGGWMILCPPPHTHTLLKVWAMAPVGSTFLRPSLMPTVEA